MWDFRKLAWLTRQVRPVEAAARVRLAALKSLSRNRRPPLPPDPAARRVFQATANAQMLRKAFDSSGLCENCAAEAERALAGDFTLFGGLVHHADGGTPDWFAAFPSGERWEGAFSFDMDISGGGGRDVRFTWELSRHGDLAALARAAFLTGRNLYFKRLEELLADWIESNPYLRGPNWMSALEVALRAVSWVFIDDAAPVRDREFRSRFLRTLYLHGLYIERFMSAGLNPSNHVIGEAAGLFVLGGKFGACEAGGRWRAHAKRILETEIRRQVFPSGASREQSVGYHRFVTGLFTLCLAVSAGGEFSPSYRERLGRMYEFLAEVARPDGSFPRMGDSDEAVALRLSPPAPGYLGGDLELGAALFPDAPFAADAPRAEVSPEAPFAAGGRGGRVSPEALWLLGPAAVGGEAGAVEKRQARRSVLVPDVGLAVLRDGAGKIQMEFDCGAQGYSPVASHGHADALSVTLWRKGERLIDAGTYRYNGTREWRDAFRSSAFHNTVTVDGISQAAPAAPFRWLTLADARPAGEFFSREFDWVKGVLEPARGRPWRHGREVLRAGAEIVILIDTVSWRGEHTAEARFHAGGAEIEREGRAAKAVYEDGGTMHIFPASSAALSVVDDSQGSGGAWRSPSYGVKEPSAALAASARFRSRVVLPWLIAFGNDATFTPVEPELGDASVTRIRCEGTTYTFVWLPQVGLVHLPNVRFAGRWALLRMEGEEIVRAWAADAWALEAAGKRLFTRLGGESVGCIHGGR